MRYVLKAVNTGVERGRQLCGACRNQLGIYLGFFYFYNSYDKEMGVLDSHHVEGVTSCISFIISSSSGQEVGVPDSHRAVGCHYHVSVSLILYSYILDVGVWDSRLMQGLSFVVSHHVSVLSFNIPLGRKWESRTPNMHRDIAPSVSVQLFCMYMQYGSPGLPLCVVQSYIPIPCGSPGLPQCSGNSLWWYVCNLFFL
jgi:hypothetical protein